MPNDDTVDTQDRATAGVPRRVLVGSNIEDDADFARDCTRRFDGVTPLNRATRAPPTRPFAVAGERDCKPARLP